MGGGSRRGRLVAMALGLAWLACAPPSAWALDPPDGFGLNAGTTFFGGPRTPVGAQVRALAGTGVGVVRTGADWATVQPTAPPAAGPPAFDWRTTDAIAAALAGEGLRWYVLLGYTTSWGTRTPGLAYAPPRPDAFAAYAAAVVRRYGRGGSYWRAHPELPYVPATSFEVYNEPNHAFFWTRAPEPGRYAELLATAHAAIKDADPHARVVLGGLDHSGPSGSDAAGFLRAMAAARPGVVRAFDAVGVHVYGEQPGDVLPRVATARRALADLGIPDVPLDLNETGWTTAGALPATARPVSEAARAARLDELLRLLAANDCGVATVMPYAWTTQEVNPADQSHWFGLAEPRTAVVRPSGAALRAAVTALRAAPPAVQPGACGRPDLPGLRLARPAPRPFRLRAARACRARRATVRWTTGALAEPLRAFSLRVGRRLVRRSDPDGAGTAPVPTSVQVTVPRGGARLAIRAYDELGVERARASLRVPACASRASDGAPTARPESAARTMKMSALDRT